MSALRKPTPEEYLERERRAECKSEYRDGEIRAMAGASVPHNRLTANLVRELGNALKNRSCDVFSQDLKTRTTPTKYAYPDVVVVCGEPEFFDEHEDVIVNPTAIFETRSPSTESFDRGDKFADYQQRDSLQEYILVAQDRVSVERFTRQPGGLWLYQRLHSREDALTLESVGVTIPLDEIYYRLSFE
jgi:Uma2 family endonuclease